MRCLLFFFALSGQFLFHSKLEVDRFEAGEVGEYQSYQIITLGILEYIPYKWRKIFEGIYSRIRVGASPIAEGKRESRVCVTVG